MRHDGRARSLPFQVACQLQYAIAAASITFVVGQRSGDVAAVGFIPLRLKIHDNLQKDSVHGKAGSGLAIYNLALPHANSTTYSPIPGAGRSKPSKPRILEQHY